MASAVLMPKVGISVETCVITEWFKQPGDQVKIGDILFSYETDKSSVECESTAEGVLLARFFENGDEVPVLVNVCAIGDAGEDVSALRPGGAVEPTPAEAMVEALMAAKTARPSAVGIIPAHTGELKISPRARHLAEKSHIDARLAIPTGPYGRIVEKDIRALMALGLGATAAAADAVSAAAPGSYPGGGVGGRVSVGDLHLPKEQEEKPAPVAEPAAEYQDIPFSGIRRVIAASMAKSLATIPQLTHNFSFNATAILAYRKQLKAGGETLGVGGITLGDMVLFAVSRLLPKYPALNAHMVEDNAIRLYKPVHLGFACDTERGLMVPVVRNADQKSLLEISLEVKALAKAAQAGSLSPDAMAGGTFTVSNLGAYGVESFTPVINPPQTGILGVDTIVNRPVEIDGQIKLYPAMGLSLTYDHRAIDGGPASRFVQELSRLLEQFTLLLAQ
ncbi:MAG: 2-oxo acid dehydrogenase subunit E2 [Oscillospiraceae bacterium]|jgi:pyruvate dehydrogenase E2 component (dihydrolipoamide acetyltransferase)|nr:2-oxo acid dehydrogenase subunit E2 [Oscillospiraceae bacterium]